MFVIKRDGSKENFNINKIFNAVKNAYKAANAEYNNNIEEDIISCFYMPNVNEYNIEKIQDKVENILMDYNKSAAKAFILYREERSKERKHAENTEKFIDQFTKSINTANATIDDNSNVNLKNIAVLNAESHKRDNQNDNYRIWGKILHEMYPELTYKDMKKDFDTIMYCHDSSSMLLAPYCMSVTLYPFLKHGLSGLGGKSATPKSLESFCGIYVNLVFALASEVKGAVATPSVLTIMDYFCRKEWGEDYYLHSKEITTTPIVRKQKTIEEQIDQYFQQITYSLNQVASSRGAQSPFTNFSFFDRDYFHAMFDDVILPDGTKLIWESTNWLQRRYLHWLNQERLKCVLTFPVCSYSLYTKDGVFQDQETYNFVCEEYAQGNSFFTYISDSIDSLSACCRLRSAVDENTFSFTNGLIGLQTGSKNVITLNLNRITQDYCNNNKSKTIIGLKNYLKPIIERVYKYHKAYDKILHENFKKGLYLAYKDGFIDLNKQYLTIGINGLNQAAEFWGLTVGNNEDYKEFCREIFGFIKTQNEFQRSANQRFNTEQVPAESAAIKLYNRDKKDKYFVPSDTNLYASYVFKPNDNKISILDKIYMHSESFATDCLDGGASCHINLDNHLSVEQYKKLLQYAADVKCNYLTFNVPNSECDDCGYITKHPINTCPRCGSRKISYYDRVIG